MYNHRLHRKPIKPGSGEADRCIYIKMINDKTTEYFFIGLVIFVVLFVIYCCISSTMKQFSGKWNLGNFFFGLLLIFIGIDFLLNPVSYTYRAQYDLRGWLKWVASFFALTPGVYLLLNSKRPYEDKK